MAAVIECRGLTKRYRGATALAGLDLTVEAGQVFGFLGANGPARPPPCGSCWGWSPRAPGGPG